VVGFHDRCRDVAGDFVVADRSVRILSKLICAIQVLESKSVQFHLANRDKSGRISDQQAKVRMVSAVCSKLPEPMP